MTLERQAPGVAQSSRHKLWVSLALLVGAWTFMTLLLASSNGLWFSDAARHGANGLFWLDFLQRPTLDVEQFAYRYYARYPVIGPTAYPPGFYLLEAGAFAVFGASPYVANGLVLAFALMLGVYTMAWCRRWIGPSAGWVGALVVLAPGVVMWSHAIMLNIPAAALCTGGLYHIRNWLESPAHSVRWRQLALGAGLCAAAVLTYLTSFLLLPIIVLWLVLRRQWRLLTFWRTWAIAGGAVLIVLPWIWVTLKFEQYRFGQTMRSDRTLLDLSSYGEQLTFYLRGLVEIVGPYVLVAAACGLQAVFARRRRGEALLMAAWVAVYFAYLCYLPFHDVRYVLPLVVPLTILAGLAVASLGQLAQRLGTNWTGRAMAITVAALIALGVWQAWAVRLPDIGGLEAAEAFVRHNAADEPVFYAGSHFKEFTFMVQSHDSTFRRRVMPACKLLYVDSMWAPAVSLAHGPEQVVDMLREHGGCRWLVVERTFDADGLRDQPEPVGPAADLRQALESPAFTRVQSFRGCKHFQLDIYRLTGPVRRQQEVRLPFLVGNGEVQWKTCKPIQ